MEELLSFINDYKFQLLRDYILEKKMGFSIKTLNRRFKREYGFTIAEYHKNYVVKNIINTAEAEEKSTKKFFQEMIDKGIGTYWSDYKSFNKFKNNKKQ